MTMYRIAIASAAQGKTPHSLIGFYGPALQGTTLAAQLGVASPGGRETMTVAVGETRAVPGLGSITVIDVRVGSDDSSSHVLVDVDDAP